MNGISIKRKDVICAILVKNENNNTISEDVEVNEIYLSRRLSVRHKATENHPAYTTLYPYNIEGVIYDVLMHGSLKVNNNTQFGRFMIYTNYNNPSIFKVENDTIIINMMSGQESNGKIYTKSLLNSIIKIKLNDSALARLFKWINRHYTQ